MGLSKRTTKLSINIDNKKDGGTNTNKKNYLFATKDLLNKARVFYTDFFLTHSLKFEEKVSYFSEKEQKEKERKINNKELLSWSESLTLETKKNPTVLEGWDFKNLFPDFPKNLRRSVINDSIGRVRSHLSNYKNWENSGKKKGEPGLPKAKNHITLYKDAYDLDLEQRFVSIKVFTGSKWEWVNYPIKRNHWVKKRLSENGWNALSPSLIVKEKYIGLHFPQEKTIEAKKVKESKENPALFTVAVDLNVKNLAVVTVRQFGKIVYTEFVKDEGLDQHRYQHSKVVSFKQYQSGKPVKGERSNRKIWDHVKRTNEDFAHKVSRRITTICRNYPECVLLFENLRKIKNSGGSKSRRLNRKWANQIKGKINSYSKEKAFAFGIVCCGEKGERFSTINGSYEAYKGGKLFHCRTAGIRPMQILTQA